MTKITSVFGVKILVEPAKEELTDERESGLLVVENKAVKPLKGVIFMIGGQTNYELSKRGDEGLSVGDTILYDRTEYPTLVSDGKEYQKIYLDNVICKLSQNS